MQTCVHIPLKMLQCTVCKPQIIAVCWMCVRAAAAVWVQTVQTDHQALKKISPLWAGQLYITESKQSVSRTLSHLFLSPCLSAHHSLFISSYLFFTERLPLSASHLTNLSLLVSAFAAGMEHWIRPSLYLQNFWWEKHISQHVIDINLY